MTLQAIAAMAANRVIGDGDRLPWRLPEDLARFKRLTMGGTLLLGRKTYESIGRPLPGRTTVVVSRQPGYAPEGVLVAGSLDEALERAGAAPAPLDPVGRLPRALRAASRRSSESNGASAEVTGEGNVWIAGGAEIYRQALGRAERLYLTRIEADFPGDAFFPELDPDTWHLVEEERRPATEGFPHPYRFEVWERRL
jgi:dihydrofolate reductase